MVIRPIFGYFAFLAIAFLLSNKRNFVRKERVVYGIVLQIFLVFAMTNVPMIVSGIENAASGIMKLKDATIEGTKFVFGYLGGGNLPFNSNGSSFILAFQALPTVILVSIISAILAYTKIMPLISKIIGPIFKYVFGVRDSIGTVSAAKIFLGQFEAPLLIKTQLSTLTNSEVFLIMSFAFSTASCSLMPIYAAALSNVCPNAMIHIMISSVIGVISTLIVCSIIMPNENTNTLENSTEFENPYPDFMSAISGGIKDGAFVWWAVVGSLIGMVALIAIINYILALFPEVGGSNVTLQRILGICAYPFAWILGIPDQDIFSVSQIIGTKFVLNEMIAFFDMSNMVNLSKESIVSTIYAITNFGNFACIGMTVGGLMAMFPGNSRCQASIPSLGFKAFIAGTIATGLTSTLMSFFTML